LNQFCEKPLHITFKYKPGVKYKSIVVVYTQIESDRTSLRIISVRHMKLTVF